VGYVNRVADRNAMGVNLTNYGFLGNNFTSRSPSMEYPLGSGYEHLVNGGLWIGAQATDVAGAFTGVTTACLDGTQGIASQSGTEFTPASRSFHLRSTLPTSPYYDPDAVSELDLIGPFDDLTAKQASNNPEVHRPLGVEVRQESYAWSYAPYADILFLRYTITNHGAPLSNVWVGLFTELMSGPKNAYSCWPPSSACSVYGSWFSKAWLEYDAPLRLLREHRCAGYPIPGGCQLGRHAVLGRRESADAARPCAVAERHARGVELVAGQHRSRPGHRALRHSERRHDPEPHDARCDAGDRRPGRAARARPVRLDRLGRQHSCRLRARRRRRDHGHPGARDSGAAALRRGLPR
jgi:hypothetical protein